MNWGFPSDTAYVKRQEAMRLMAAPLTPPLSVDEQGVVERFEQAPPFPCRVCDEAGEVDALVLIAAGVRPRTWVRIPCPACTAVTQ